MAVVPDLLVQVTRWDGSEKPIILYMCTWDISADFMDFSFLFPTSLIILYLTKIIDSKLGRGIKLLSSSITHNEQAKHNIPSHGKIYKINK